MIWAVMIAAGLMTFAARYSMIGLLGDRPIPERLKRLLGYVGPAVMAAIIAPEVLVTGDMINVMDNPRIPAFIGASIVAFWTRSVPLTILTGMLLLWGIEFITG
ncbi:AzlD domain-containing protein [Alphaproteobacteria bacterium LSUCC0684]